MPSQLPEPLLEPDPGWRSVQGDRYGILIDTPGDTRLAFAESVARGLSEEPRTLDCRYLYDDEGSAAFERITEQPEYYQTRTEASILAASAESVREGAGATTLVELGSGSSTKTRHLLRAWCARGPTRYVPIDVNAGMLETASKELTGEFDNLRVEAIAASYERALPYLKSLSPVTLVFLGSTLGNLDHEQLDGFLEMVSAHLSPGDAFLLGVDVLKAPGIIEAAYNDAAGWTARFTRNLFQRMNRELGTEVPDDAVEHVAYYNDQLSRIEIYARFLREVNLRIPLVGREFRIARGEMIRTEISRKFRPADIGANASRFGFSMEQVLTDPDELFAVLLLRRGPEMPVAEDRRQARLADLRRTRARTFELIDSLPDAALVRTPQFPMRPVLWELAHVAEFEADWTGRSPHAPIESESIGSAAEPCSLDEAADDPRIAEPLDRAAVLSRLDLVRAATVRQLESVTFDPSSPLTGDGHVYRVVSQHEASHQELVLQVLEADDSLTSQPIFDGVRPQYPDRSLRGERRLVPSGGFELGTDADSAALDRERPGHEVELSPFWIDAVPVTNGEFVAFIDDQGYRRRELWSEEGWSWLQSVSIEAPSHWRRSDRGWRVHSFGRSEPLDANRPVVHVSAHEAEAFARWVGKRLPTEAEWEKAASWDPERNRARTYPWGDALPTAEHANLDQRLGGPAPVGSYPRGRSFYGCHQMLGDVWEWTSSAFVPYPGFVASPGKGISAASFHPDKRVLRGGSWATSLLAVRATSRRGVRPEHRHVFSGFRCASDA